MHRPSEGARAADTRLKALEANQQELMYRLTNSEAQIEEINTESQGKPKVAFSASLGSNVYYGPFNTHSTVVYKNVFINVGDAYHQNTRIFTAPVRGVYYFSFFYHCGTENPTVLALYRNGKREATTKHHKSQSPPQNGGNGLILLLEKGDHVYMVLLKNSWVWDNISENVLMFSGFLINAM
ncbi:cerebellin-2-like [Siphateles boraxobius]|uniref:cerebellin-2-like n=1 Tax=Siphateles boraxobius TaxID=180520 RepID=UPI004063A0E4